MALTSQFVHERLREATKRYRRSRSGRFAISGLAAALALLVVFLLADAQFHFGAVGRWTAFVLVIAPLLIGTFLSIRAALPTISESSMARRLEVAAGGAQNVLISAVQFDRELPKHSSLRAALFAEMRDPFPQVDWSLVLDLKLLKRLAIGLASTVFVLVLCAVVRPEYFVNSAKRILMPASKIAPLTRTQFVQITPGDARVIHGRDLSLNVRLNGEIPRAAWLYFREAGGSWQKVLMEHEVGGPAFSFEWKEVRQPLEYYVAAGDAWSSTFQITVRPRTAIGGRAAEIMPPAYANLGKATLKDFAVLQNVLPGSNISIALEFNNPLAQLSAYDDKAQKLAVQKLTPTKWQIAGTVTTNATLKLAYTDTDEVDDSESIQIAVTPDEPPKITVSTPAEGKEIFAAPNTSLPIQFSATDNLGLATVALYRSTDEAQDGQLIQEWKKAAGQKAFTGNLTLPLAKYGKEDRVTFCVVAKDQNNVSGPGITYSRPIVVTLRSAEQVQEKTDEAANKVQNGLEALIKLQQTNLEETVAANRDATPETLNPLLNRQGNIADRGRSLATSTEALAPSARADLAALSENEMPNAVLALRTAVSASGDVRMAALAKAVNLETTILVRLQGAAKSLSNETSRGQVQDLIAGVEDLLRKQRDLLRETNAAAPQSGKSLSDRQDLLSGDARRVKKQLEKSAQDAAVGDQDFRTRIGKAVTMFGEMKIYEEMLAAAEKLQTPDFQAAGTIEKSVVANLAKLVEMLNQWQLAKAESEAEALRKAAKDMADKLAKLAEIQKEILEKSKELARKADMRPEDIATAKEMKQTKDLMAQVVEQMLTDAHVFPDLKPSNELRGELTQIYEDVIQADAEDAAAGKLKANEVAVQKEDSLLQAIEQAKKVSEDLEMWLPNKNDTTKWLCENFDKTEMPDIPNLPLPDAFEDLVGDLLQEQAGLAEEAKDAASNQALAQATQGWGVADGPMPGFSAQGKSGNTRPNKNEQTGRSSGGREGMSNGEMVGDTASTLEGTTPDVRRTNDPMQQGHVKDDGGIQKARATGGGKAGGFSDRNGMDGNAPLRAVNAPRMGASDALAVQQALLSEKTAKTYGQASLLYLKATGLPEVEHLMDQSQLALKEGRVADFRSLHQKIVARLNEVRGAVVPGNVISLSNGDAARAKGKQLLGGDEGQAPPAYKRAVADYYRSLLEDQ